MVQTGTGRWADRQPLWLYVTIRFAAVFVVWTAWAYLAASLTGAAYVGFDHGRFSFYQALAVAAVWTAAGVGSRWRRQGRKAIFWLPLFPVTLAGGLFLMAVLDGLIG